ncbi:hypothetical protein [Streptomyces sp. NPDC047453]|uniref:hypothetical protein n=1 Tax=Streptomyces sp. NPDC047453 TaxID=3154812 RepID=UPI0033C03DB4
MLWEGDQIGREDMSFYSVVDAASTWTAIPFASIGFGITIYQTYKAKNAAESAQLAAENVRESISKASLLVLLPQLHRAEEQLERSVRDRSLDLTISWLSTWRWQAGQVRGLLDDADPSQREMIISLQASISAAASAKSKLIEVDSPDIVAITKTARQSVGKVISALGAMTSALGMQAGGVGNGS